MKRFISHLIAVSAVLVTAVAENGTPSWRWDFNPKNRKWSAPNGWAVTEKNGKLEYRFSQPRQQLRSEGLQNRGARLLLNLARPRPLVRRCAGNSSPKTGN